MNIDSPKTKIVCTIGPASESREVMKQMIEAGMNVARLNFSHGEFAAHKKNIENLRAVSLALGRRIAIMADLSGPKMRIGSVTPEPTELKVGDNFVLTTDQDASGAGRVSVTFMGLPAAVRPGDILFLNDGYIQLKVVEVKGNDVVCTVLVGGEIRSRKGLNLPGIDLGISAFTERDHECLKFALENGVDAVSQSFVESAADIEAVRKAAGDLGYSPFIIAKIERSGALKHIEGILRAADGIMVARGDLGVEIPIEDIAVVQKRIIRLANMLAKPVITATQMLESMVDNRRPTRAEATDVANAIFDGTDCVMLSAESAMGRYPVDAVAMLAKIAASSEAHRPAHTVQGLFTGINLKGKVRPEHLIAISVQACMEYAMPAAVFVPTRSGATARNIARFRLPVWTVAISTNEATCRHLQFSSGVFPVQEQETPENWKEYVSAWVDAHGLKGDLALVTEGPSYRHPEANHSMDIIELSAHAGRKEAS
jgi:pyruvate kinase